MLRAAGLVSILLSCLAGCRSDAAGRGATTPTTPAAAPTAATSSATSTPPLATQLAWLPRETISVARLRPGSIFVLDWLAGLIGGPRPDCWQRIEKTIDAGYMFETAPGRSLLGFQSASERGDIERCIESGFPAGHLLHAALQRDGDLTIIETAAGRALLWWQGDGWVVSGSPEDIKQVRSAKQLGLDVCTRRVLELLPDRPIAYGSCSRTFEGLLGVPTRGWVLGASADERPGFRAAVTVFYASAGDAARARGALAPDRLPAALPAPLRNWLGRLPSAVEENRLEIRVDVSKADFDKLDVAAVTRMTEEMKRSQEDADQDELEKYWQEQKKAAEERKKTKGP